MWAEPSWGWLALPAAALLGALCARIAQAYAGRIAQGAEADAATLRSALAAVALRREPPAAFGSAVVGAALLMPAGACFAAQPSWVAAAQLAACAALLLLACIDARCGLLPDALTLPLLWAGLLMAWAGSGVGLHDAVAAAAAAYVLLRVTDALFQLWRGQAGMGGGDMKLAAALGAWLGWAPLPGVLLAACCAGLLFAVLRRSGSAWRAAFAFGPFLALAGAAGLLGGPVVQLLF